MFVFCDCGYDSGDCENIYELKEKIYEDGGDFSNKICPKCKCSTLKD